MTQRQQTGESHINVTSVTTTFFASQLLRLHTKIELCIFQALDIADVNDFFFTLWLSKLQIAALSKASMQNVKLNSASLAFLNV